MCILVLAVKVSGDQLSVINVAGLALCLLGISGHIVHKVLFIRAVAGKFLGFCILNFDCVTKPSSAGQTR